MGFKEVAKLQGFVRDLEGTESDLVLMVKYLQHWNESQSQGGAEAQAF
jgi:hypothetical protein